MYYRGLIGKIRECFDVFVVIIFVILLLFITFGMVILAIFHGIIHGICMRILLIGVTEEDRKESTNDSFEHISECYASYYEIHNNIYSKIMGL